MRRSRRRSEDLDLERDLVTTAADVEALRRNRATLAPGSLVDLEWLTPPTVGPDPPQRRTTFPAQPPFEL